MYTDKYWLMQGDCLELMKNIPDGLVDLVLTDPPYGTTRNMWDTVIPFGELWSQYERIIKENGVIALFCDGLFTANLIQSNTKMWRYNLVWDKQRGCDFLNANIKPLKSHEDISIFYKKKPTFNKQLWYATPYKRTKNGSLSDNYGNRKEAWTESADGARNPLTILSFPRDGNRYHPTQKPVPLLEYLVKTYTNEGDTVLDNCMGSGSTGVACMNTNRHFIGIELDDGYFEVAKKRGFKMNIVIEGCDGTGKSTIAKHLCKCFGLHYWHESQPRTFYEYRSMLEYGGFVFDRFCFGQFVYNAPEERKMTPEELTKLVTEVFFKTGTVLLYVEAKTDTVIQRLIQRGEGDPKQTAEMEKWVKNIRGTYRQILRESGAAYIEINGEGGGNYA